MDNYGKGRPSVMKITRLLLDEDGWRGFYRGFGPSFLNMFVSRLKINNKMGV
jgi:solute carrier family 25, member 44